MLSIIIPTKNSYKTLQNLLESIDIKIQDLEVIIVDNINSNDNLKKILENSHFVYIKKGKERSEQRNIGAEYAKGEYLFFVDSDMVLNSDTINEVLRIIKKYKNQKKIFAINEIVPGKSIYARARNIEKRIYKNNLTVSAARVFPKKEFLAIGGYDEELYATEDWNLHAKFVESNYECIFLQNTLIHNEKDLGFRASILKKMYYAKNIKKNKIKTKQINPVYRILLLFSKPKFIFEDFFAFVYLIILKVSEFFIGVIVLFTSYGSTR